jgi:glycosyltransferase involved in cell wall biosynthesis
MCQTNAAVGIPRSTATHRGRRSKHNLADMTTLQAVSRTPHSNARSQGIVWIPSGTSGGAREEVISPMGWTPDSALSAAADRNAVAWPIPASNGPGPQAGKYDVCETSDAREGFMTSIVIAAHNEEAVLGACLDTLDPGGTDSLLEIIVVANGCVDATASVARTCAGVTVLELEQGSKPTALNSGDAVATSFPRIYLDADIVVPAGGVDALVEALDASGALAAAPDRVLNTAGRPWPVRAYFAISERLPVFRDALFGRGMIALSAEGRARFGTFPLMVADDLFLDSLFGPDERARVPAFAITIDSPFTTRALVRRLVRVRRGNAAMRRASELGIVEARVRRADRWAWLRDVVVPEPRLAPAGIAYAAITVLAALLARKGPATSLAWGRDESSRRQRGAGH